MLYIYCDIEDLENILREEYDECEPQTGFTVNLVRRPYSIVFNSKDEVVDMKVYARTDIYDRKCKSGVLVGGYTLNTVSGLAEVRYSNVLSRGVIVQFLQYCMELAKFLQSRGLLLPDLELECSGENTLVLGNPAKKKNGDPRPDMLWAVSYDEPVVLYTGTDNVKEIMMTQMMSVKETVNAAEKGNPHAIKKLATGYFFGEYGMKQNVENAKHWIDRGIEMHLGECADCLAILYEEGFTVEQDFKQAAEWAERAIEWGLPGAKELLDIYQEYEKNLRLAESNDAEAMAAVAENYMNIGCTALFKPIRNFQQGVNWAQKAIKSGCAGGYWPLGRVYQNGYGIKKNPRKAVELYRKGADAGSAACQNAYACMLMSGIDVKRDYAQTYDLLVKAAEQGFMPAYYNLGAMHDNGFYVEKDIRKAYEWYDKSLMSGKHDSERIHSVGIGYSKLMGENKELWLYALQRMIHWLRVAAVMTDGKTQRDADLAACILEMYKKGVIPSGTSFEKCAKYVLSLGEKNCYAVVI